MVCTQLLQSAVWNESTNCLTTEFHFTSNVLGGDGGVSNWSRASVPTQDWYVTMASSSSVELSGTSHFNSTSPDTLDKPFPSETTLMFSLITAVMFPGGGGERIRRIWIASLQLPRPNWFTARIWSKENFVH